MSSSAIDWGKTIPIIISVISLCFAYFAYDLSKKSDSRSEKLYIAQRISSIQVTPLSFDEYYYDGKPMGRINLQVTNYTGFKATNLKLDAKFENQWIMEWLIAAIRGLSEQEKKEILTDKLQSELNSYKMALFKNTFNIEPNKSITYVFQGGLNFDRSKTKIITVRTIWTSENGAQFDKIFKYELISTQAYGSESLTLIPIETEEQLNRK